MLINFFIKIFLLLLFFIFNANILNSSLLNTADEIMLFLALFILILYTLSNLIKGYLYKIFVFFYLYLFAQVINYFFSPFELKLGLVLIQSLINIKVFIISLAFLLLLPYIKKYEKIIKIIYFSFLGLFIFGFIMNLILGETWNTLVGFETTYRYGFLRPAGYFVSYAQNAYYFAMTFTTLILLYNKKHMLNPFVLIQKFFLFVIIDFLMAFILSVRKGLFMSIPFGIFAFSNLHIRSKIFFIFFGFLFFGIFILSISEMQIFQDTVRNLQYMLHNDHTYKRGLMVFYGFFLFIDFFPFGTGAATFGTVLSEFNTMEVYEYIELPASMYIDGKVLGMYDSGLATLIAENGFIGMIPLLIFIYYFFQFNKVRLNTYYYNIFSLLTWFTLLLSLTEPVLQNGLFTVFYVINILFIYIKDFEEKTLKEKIKNNE